MAASITDKFVDPNSSGRPVPTTLTAEKQVADGSITCASLSGWATATAVHFCIYETDTDGNKVAGTQSDWKGIVSGSTINTLTLTGGTDQVYPIGSTVVAAPTAGWGSDLVTGLLVEHDQDGTHGALTAASVVSAGAVTGTTVTGTSVVSSGDIQHRSTSLETIRSELEFDFVASGLVWSGDAYASTRAASMTAGVAYIGGRRFAISAVTARSFTASKDTYIDIDNTGTLVYTEVTNNAASPALAAGSLRIGIIVTGASNIASAGSVNQGQIDKALPIASSIPYTVTDSLGNLICPRDPQRRTLGYRQITSTFTTTSTSFTQVTGLTAPVIVPTGRKVRITVSAREMFLGTSGSVQSSVWEGVVNSGTQLSASLFANGGSSGVTGNAITTAIRTPASSSVTYNAGFSTSAGTGSFVATSVAPAYIKVELI